jgi:uncharacterized protein YoxC
MQLKLRTNILLPIFFMVCLSYAQPGMAMQDSTKKYVSPDTPLSEHSYQQLSNQYEKLTGRLRKKNIHLLKRALATENKLRKGKDSIAAKDKQAYQQLQDKINQINPSVHRIKDYLPALDSLRTGIRLLQQSGATGALGNVGNSLDALQHQWQTSMDIQSFLRERRNQLKQYLLQVGRLKELKQLNKELYYYQQQLQEYRSLLKEPDKLAVKLLGIARQHPQFNTFMSRNSLLSQLFQVPGATPDPVALAGLQTRTGTQNLLQQQLQGMGGNSDPSQYLQSQVQAANTAMNNLKDKINQAGGGGSSMEIPDFKPNSQKTKTFWKRLEWGLNIQSQKPNGLFPVTTDMALTVGYKLNDKSTIGTGLSYKMGWGKNFNDIRISHQGIGLRSFVDMKLKGSIWISGGYELNQYQEITRLEMLRDMSSWQRSGLIGLTKKFNAGKKKGNLQLLWDFLSYSQVPQSRALKFRIGYTF